MKLVIVESPAKAKTINKYLGKDYQVVASYGHIRDLPSKNGSVIPEENFTMIYEVNDKSRKHIKPIIDASKKAEQIFLATDPDREGESISWHIVEALKDLKAIKKNIPVKRVVFNEITKKAVLEAMQHPRDIDMDLVNAQQARRALDYLVGFTLSPVLWRKLPGSRSAGRVQSVALRLICDREVEIETFITREYWDIKVNLLNKQDELFTSTLTHLNGEKLDKFALSSEKEAQKIVQFLQKKLYHVDNIEEKQVKRNPLPPFITSSLQQEASRKLGFSPDYTMRLAQKLYEGVSIEGETVGLITYMRTDGVQLAQEATNSIRQLINKSFGKEYLPSSPRIYKSKVKNAQEAHEAIRPTNVNLDPLQAKKYLDKNSFELYELIWKRTVACQMESAILNVLSVIIKTDDNETILKATGSTLKFDGFYRLYREILDSDSNNNEEEENKILPKLDIGDKLKLSEVLPRQHFTEPPPRFSEASLIKKLEELGIGRPSTYAPTISLLQDRNYIHLDKKRFIPDERGRLVTTFLISFFQRYVEYDFTAKLENELDHISAGDLEWKLFLKNFWYDFEANVTEVKQYDIGQILEKISILLEPYLFPNSDKNKECPSCTNGTLALKLGKFGAFIACSNYPECKYTRKIGDSDEQDTPIVADINKLGIDEDTGLDITLRQGPYGYYIQLGEADEENKKPKRISLPKSIDPQELSLEQAKALLNLPREVGIHPETGQVVKAGIGRFGPYLFYNKSYTSIPASDDILTIGINRAVSLIAEKGSKKIEPVKVLGMHPVLNQELAVYEGRYGLYIKLGKVNISLPKNINLDELTLQETVDIVDTYQEKHPEKKISSKKTTTTKKKKAKS
ncbi:DNA topoisomerase 1 [Rickettsiales bacterium Ac37b]|nr:DNA topoisomerase 1 [Rickettsiales bacterium Ac37b]